MFDLDGAHVEKLSDWIEKNFSQNYFVRKIHLLMSMMDNVRALRSYGRGSPSRDTLQKLVNNNSSIDR